MSSFFRMLFKTLLVFVVIFVMAGAFLTWRLSHGPLRVNFVKNYITKHIPGLTFDDLRIDWPSLRTPPKILIDGAQYDGEGIHAHIAEVGLTIDVWHLFFHALRVDRVTIEKAEITVALPSTPASTNASPVSESSAGMLYIFDNLQIAKETFFHHFPLIEFFKSRVLFQRNDATAYQLDKLSGALSYTARRLAGKIISECIIGDFKVPIELRFKHTGGNKLSTQVAFSHVNTQDLNAAFQLQSDILSFFTHPFAGKFSIDVEMEDQHALHSHITGKLYAYFAALSAGDTESKNYVPLSIEGDVRLKKEALQYQLTTSLKNAATEVLPVLWPSTLGVSARNWFLHNILGGVVSYADISTHGTLNIQTKQHARQELGGHIHLTDVGVDYITGMPPVEKANATSTFNEKSFDILIQKGHVGNLEIQSGTVSLFDLDKAQEQGDVHLNIAGPFQDVIWLIDHPPLEYAKRYNFSKESVAGHANVDLRLRFPLSTSITVADVKTAIEGHIQQGEIHQTLMASPLDITESDLHITVDNKSLKAEGKGLFNGQVVQLTWQENFMLEAPYDQRYHVITTQKAIALFPFGLTFLKDYVEDTVGLDLTYTRKGQKGRLAFHVDGYDALISAAIFDWFKAKGRDCTITGTLHLLKDTPSQIEGLRIQSQDFHLAGYIGFKKGTLHTLTFNKIETPRSSYHLFLQTPQPNHWTGKIEGKYLDLAPYLTFFKQTEQTKDAPKKHLSLTFAFDRGFLKNGVGLHGVSGHFRKGGPSLSLQVRADFEKGGYLNLKYLPDPQNREQKLYGETNDIGTLMKGLDITKGLSGGKVTLTGGYQLTSKDEPPLIGKLYVKNLHSKNMPLLAKILTITSFTDMATLLGGEGIIFDEGKLKFEARDGKIVVQDGHIHNSSLGLTGYGTIDLTGNKINFEGVVVPAYNFNRMLGYFPILGQILSGGNPKEGVFSFFYSITGALQSPEVSVNPISALAPGFIKNMVKNQPTLETPKATG